MFRFIFDYTKRIGLHYNYILFLTNVVTPFIITPYIVRVIGFDNFGHLAIFSSILLIYNLIVDYGFAINGPKKVALDYYNKIDLSQSFSTITFIKLSIFTIILLGSFIFLNSTKISSDNSKLYYFLILILFSNALNPYWFFSGIGDLRIYTYLSIISKIILIFLLFYFLKSKDDYLKVQLIFFTSNFFLSICSNIYIFKRHKVNLHLPSFKLLIDTVNDGKFIFTSTLINGLYTNLPIIIIGKSFNTQYVGYFSSSEKVIKIFQNIFSPFFQSIFPIFIKENESVKKSSLNLKTILIVVIVLSCILSFLLYINSKNIVYIFYKSKNQELIKIFSLMCFLPITYVLNNIFTMFLMTSSKSQKQYSIFFSSLVFVFLIIFYYFASLGNISLVILSIFLAEILFIVSFIGLSTKNSLNIFIND
jgi:PST family polysaccharide transporter